MYTLAYVERAERQLGLLTAPRRRFRIERFATVDAALVRARAIIVLPAVSAVELHTIHGDVVLDARELACELGTKARLSVEPRPEGIMSPVALPD